jgi:isopentenyl phosphate kinase
MSKTEVPNPGKELVFLKLGGSLITDKTVPRTSRLEIIQRICTEIQSALAENSGLQIILGHGSGSFGHISGSKYQTRKGVTSEEDWRGFAEVWRDASDLNRLVMEELHQAGLPAIAFPPSAAAVSHNRIIKNWNLEPLVAALDHQLLPVIYGDVIFDTNLGGTILSTEELFIHLARELEPDRILLAGQDAGVWKDYPQCTILYQQLTPADKAEIEDNVLRSAATDVTGGMAGKVNLMLDLVKEYPDLEVAIFSGEQPDSIHQALLGKTTGTRLIT